MNNARPGSLFRLSACAMVRRAATAACTPENGSAGPATSGANERVVAAALDDVRSFLTRWL